MNTMLEVLKHPEPELNLATFILQYDISDFEKFCKFFAIKKEKQMISVFELVRDCPLAVQSTVPAAYKIVSTITAYPEYQAFLNNQPVKIKTMPRQTLIDQWIKYAKYCLTSDSSQYKVLTLIRLIHSIESKNGLIGGEDLFLNKLSNQLPTFEQEVIALYLEKKLYSSSQSHEVKWLIHLLLKVSQAHPKLHQSIKLIGHFNTPIALRLLALQYASLDSFPLEALKMGLKNKRLTLESFNVLIQNLPYLQKLQARKCLIDEMPSLTDSIIKSWYEEIPHLSPNELKLSQEFLSENQLDPQSSKVIKKMINTMNHTDESIDIHQPQLSARKAKSIVFAFKCILIIEWGRSVLTKFLGQILYACYQLPESPSQYYNERIKDLNRLLSPSFNSHSLSFAETSGLSCYVNCFRTIMNAGHLHEWSIADTHSDYYANHLKSSTPYRDLAKDSYHAVIKCII